MLFSVFAAAVAGASGVTGPATPLALADNGMVQCYRPDVEDKTCQSIASYRRTGTLAYNNVALIPVSANATLETHSPVSIKGDAVCGFIRAEDALAGTLRVDGQIVDGQKAKPILKRIGQAMVPMSGKEICTRYEAVGTELTAKVSIAGTYRPDQDETVKWINPADGYTVVP